VSEDGGKQWRIPSIRLPQLRRKTEFYIFEALALGFGASAAQFFFVDVVRWQQVVICGVGYAASFAMMVSVKCAHCREPLGRVDGKWVPIPETQCSKCGRDHG
jgi:hypothetical protein